MHSLIQPSVMQLKNRLQKYLPTREHLRDTASLKFLGELIYEPNLWHFNRHSVSYATLIGLFCCFLPIPFQMVPCVILVLWVRCNIPLAVGIVWISNPLTMAPMMYFAYRVGAWMMNEPEVVKSFPDAINLLFTQFAVIWQPLILGCLVTGLTFGSLGFALVRLYWRWKVSRNWSMRKLRKRLKQNHH
jgi:uncharacterized protein (DUF2062 family)